MRDFTRQPIERRPTDVKINLISQGRISKKEAGYSYFDAEGKPVEVRIQPSTGYKKVARMKAGEEIYRRPDKTAYKLNAQVDGSRNGNHYEITQTIYLYSDIEDDKQAEAILKRIWKEKTNFAPYQEFSKETDPPAREVGEDQIKIKTDYVEGRRKKTYEDKYETNVTMKSITFRELQKEFDESFGTANSDVKSFRRIKR